MGKYYPKNSLQYIFTVKPQSRILINSKSKKRDAMALLFRTWRLLHLEFTYLSPKCNSSRDKYLCFLLKTTSWVLWLILSKISINSFFWKLSRNKPFSSETYWTTNQKAIFKTWWTICKKKWMSSLNWMIK